MTNASFSTFNQSTDLCCDGVHHRDVSENQDCCGMMLYDPTVEICCNGHPHPFTENASCCGSGSYNTANEICCPPENHVVKTKPKVFRKEYGYLSCCGMHPYDPNNGKCCEERYLLQLNKNESQECCGHVLYNVDTEVCCDLLKHKKIDGLKCCGRKLYDPLKQLCCEDDEGLQHFVHDMIIGEHRECCGSKTYSPDDEEACCSTSLGSMYVCTIFDHY